MSDPAVVPDDGLPEALQGKTPAEMYALLQQEHMRELEEAKKAVVPPPPPPQPVQQPTYTPPPYVPPTQTTPDVDLFSDPNTFMEQQFQQRVAPLAQAVSTTMRSTNREIFKNKLGAEEWETFGQDIDKFVDSLHPTVQMQLEAYEAAANYVKGKRLPEIIEKETAKRSEETVKKVLEEYGLTPQQTPPPVPKTSLFQPVTGVVTPPSPPRHFSPTAPKRSKLTEDQQRLAKHFDMTDDEYLKYAEDNSDWISQAKREGGK
jgi:hypothetical protein